MQMPHRALVAVDDGRRIGQQLAEVPAVEHEVRAAEHHGVDRIQVVVVEIPVQRAHHQIVIVQPSALHNRHQIRTRLRVNRVIGLEPVHQRGELAFPQCQRRGGHNHPLTFPVSAVAGHLERRLHADDRDLVRVPQLVDRGRGGGVAGDHHRLDSLFHEVFHDGEREFAHLFRRLRTVGGVGGIAEVQHPLMRHGAADLMRHRDAAQAGIEHADRCR